MTSAVPQRDSLVPAYRPLMELGRGGMARVYLAESLASGFLHKLVVLKVLNQELASDPDMRSGFIREAQISARLNHPNIVHVYEVFEHGTKPVMVMQYLDGLALSEILSRLSGKVPLKMQLHILCQVLGALHYFHELRGPNGESLEAVHRDVSPHNVMVLHEGAIKVVDFGVAKVRAQSENHTRTGVIKGKVAYMPPEQLLACANVDRRADIYSVGVMLWEAVAGRRMWRGVDPSARMRAIVRGELPSIREAAPGVSDALAKIVERALAHAPDDRFATAEAMQIELEQVAYTEGGYSLPRELAEFMRVNFGEDRRERQRAVERAIEDPAFTVGDASFSASQAPSVSSERPVVRAAPTDPSLTYAPSRPWKKLVVGAAFAVGLCAVALAVSPRDSEPEAEVVSVAPTPVELRVASVPEGAEVYLDGVRVGVTPLRESRQAAVGEGTLELRAPGHVARRETISLEENVTLELALTPAPPAHRADERAGAAHVEEQAERDQVDGASRARRPTRVVSAPRSKAQDDAKAVEPSSARGGDKESAKADDCDPPYRLDPGGVKVFKPQCF